MPGWLIGAKVVLVALLVTGAVAPGVGGFEGKGMAYRLPVFAAMAAAAPLWAWLRRRPYRVGADVALTVPLLLDTAANAVGLYDRFDRTDDVLHALNWVVLVGGITHTIVELARGTRTPRWLVILAGSGAGALAAVIWETAEYAIMRSGVGGLSLTYGDTIADLVLSTSGGVVGAVAVARWLMRGATSS